MAAANHTMLLRAASLGGNTKKLLAAAKHNLREISGPNMQADKKSLNVILVGADTAIGIVSDANQRMTESGLDLTKQRARKNGALAVEFVFGLPATTPVDTDQYFRACVTWLEEIYGMPQVFSAVAHYDEGNPHCHALVLPIVAGEWRGSRLLGGKAETIALQTAFFRAVATRFGLRPPPASLALADKQALFGNILQHLKDSSAPVLQCLTWPLVRDLIARDPRPWAELLGLQIRQRLKTLTELKVSPGRGPKKERSAIEDAVRGDRKFYPVLDDPRQQAPDRPLDASIVPLQAITATDQKRAIEVPASDDRDRPHESPDRPRDSGAESPRPEEAPHKQHASESLSSSPFAGRASFVSYYKDMAGPDISTLWRGWAAPTSTRTAG